MQSLLDLSIKVAAETDAFKTYVGQNICKLQEIRDKMHKLLPSGVQLLYLGEYKLWHENGQLMEWFQVKGTAGIRISWYNCGCIHMIKRYKNNMLNGECMEYKPKGVLHIIQNYKKGKLHGKMYVNNQTESMIIYYTNGELDGPHKRYDSSGNLLFYKYFTGGTPREEYEYRNDGTLTGKKIYMDHLSHHEYQYYNNGKVSQETCYVDGLLCGELKKYRKDGSLKLLLRYQSDKLHGKCLKISKDGKETITNYYHGKRVNKSS